MKVESNSYRYKASGRVSYKSQIHGKFSLEMFPKIGNPKEQEITLRVNKMGTSLTVQDLTVLQSDIENILKKLGEKQCK